MPVKTVQTALKHRSVETTRFFFLFLPFISINGTCKSKQATRMHALRLAALFNRIL